MIDKNFFFVFTSERIFKIQNKFYCENKDIKTILEGISKKKLFRSYFKNN